MARRYYSSTAQRTTLASPLSSGATTMIVSSVAGFPGTRPYTLILDPDTLNEEIVTVTAASGTTLTVLRGEDGTAALAHDLGATVYHGFTGRDLGEPQAHMDSTDAVHGVSGDVVGTTDTQTLTGKSLDGVDNTFTNLPQSAVTGLVAGLAAKAPIDSPTFTGSPVLPATTVIGDVDAAELQRVNGVTSNIQTQLDSKAPTANPTFTGTVTLPTSTDIGGVSSAELAYLAGATSNLQAQIDAIEVGGGGTSLPPGGAAEQVLAKIDATDGNAEWVDMTIAGGDSVYLLRTQSFTGVSSFSIDTAFTSTFRSYRIIMEVIGSAETSIRYRMREWTVDNSAADYHYQQQTTDGTSVTASAATGETSGLLGKCGTTASLITGDVLDTSYPAPSIFSTTSVVGSASGMHQYMAVSSLDDSAVYQGITIFPSSGTITGRIRIYGFSENSLSVLPPTPSPDPLILFDYGDEKTATTGGWIDNSWLVGFSVAAAVGPTSIDCSAGDFNGTGAAAATTNAIDLTPYTRLYVEVAVGDKAENQLIGIGATSSGFTLQYDFEGSSVSPTEYSMNIAAYNGPFHILCGIAGANYGDLGGSHSYYRVWLQ